MGATSNTINLLGMVFLSHAVYSSYEHSLLPNASQPPPPSSILPAMLDPKINIPLDIILETVFSVLLLCVGVVLGSQDLKPIQWSVWAGRLERSKEAREITEVGAGGGNPFTSVEERPGFLDIREKRKEFAAWIKEGSGTIKA
ncbi:unnamed protein product [Zymoseptoria tritici ST99CH_1A5]|uniref:Magnesium transporter n=3 Tax=Zymoseptoria tritici TaxID=1047171 RepID=F9WWU3_ZYMTI|nr:uncharacterized protein MYCGRDRAFT_33299 [Zymoseptoria tritici IPO323]EGP91487.1 hypothetical protein MYCGRDRAFT_33299 [Zymoseptoria tritici IPO323]SMR42692.1 unnamed protein product [Zymoseptoria tritici ST99CH_1E4]SMR44866.1 unnamed protein product [Zymoseptoria tritici ST99CH_3D1]SMY20031.1 unnamed protein product [Zymoseptoria tritici ST99CH_1A5]